MTVENTLAQKEEKGAALMEKCGFLIIAEDDEDDFLLIQDAFREAGLMHTLLWVKNGEELLSYIAKLDSADGGEEHKKPDLIILDLNMPKVSGLEALKEIKLHPNLRKLPVIILSTSQSHEDIIQTYELGGNSFIQKPIRFEALVDIISTLNSYWFQVVRRPCI